MTSPSELLTYAEDDIDREFAQHAYSGVSMDPKGRGDLARREYAAYMAEVEAEFAPWVTDDNREAMGEDLARYRQGYLSRLKDYLAAESRCVSSFIAGPSNFPAACMNKRNETSHKRSVELMEWSRETLERLRRKYDPVKVANAPIKASDEDAPDKLRAKIAKAEKLQADMKAANRIVRSAKADDEKVAALVALGISEGNARELLHPHESWVRPGFAGWSLSNNLANIKRMEARLTEIERQREADTENGGARQWDFDEGIVYDDPGTDRYQLKYMAKPSAETIKALKARGFHWSPRLGVWQRQRTPNAKYAVRELTGVEL